VIHQRGRKDSMGVVQTNKLNSIGFVWSAYEHKWSQALAALNEYKTIYGHCLVPQRFKVKGFKLGNWVGFQRANKEQLSMANIDSLDALGFAWDPLEDTWIKGFEHLRNYYNIHGNSLVPYAYELEGFLLGVWVRYQRKNRPELVEDKVNKLESLNFVWTIADHKWDQGFEYLSEYKNKYGNCFVLRNYKVDGFSLDHWVSRQRKLKSSLSKDRFHKLESLGFVWKVSDEYWDLGFKHLSEYRKRFGDSVVPRSFSVRGFKLGQWVSSQRHRKTGLSEMKLKKLNSLEFKW